MRFTFFLRRVTKFLYKFRGASRLADLVRKANMWQKRSVTIHDFDGTLSFHCALDEHISSQVFWRGYYSYGQLKLLENLLKTDMVFIDAGANKGEFTLFAAKRLVNGLVIAFEPVPELFAELKANVAANHFSNVQLVNTGLADASRQAMLFKPAGKYDDELNQGLFSLYNRQNVDQPTSMVALIRLDDFIAAQPIQRVDIIKIDIEGAELEMLHGAKETILRFKPVILIEINAVTSFAAGYDARDIFYYLSDMGYRFNLVGRNGQMKPIDINNTGKFQNVVCFPIKSS